MAVPGQCTPGSRTAMCLRRTASPLSVPARIRPWADRAAGLRASVIFVENPPIETPRKEAVRLRAMPTYEYRCRDCGRDFEVFQRMSDRPVAPCPGCGRPAERLISGGAGFLFKGDGFYITDHRSEDYRRKAREEAGGGGDGKTDGKPDREAAKAPPGEAAPADERRTGAGKRESGEGKASRVAAPSGKRTRRSGTPSAGSGRGRGRGGRAPAGSTPGSGGGATGGKGT